MRCHCYDFLVCFCGTNLTFFELFKLYFHLGLITTPHVLYVHMTYVYSFSHVLFFTRLNGQEKSLSHYDLYKLQSTTLRCHRYDFLVRLLERTYFFSNFLNFYSSLGIDHDPPCSLCSHDLCLFLFHVSFFTRSCGPEKSPSYYDLFDFGVLLFYGRIPTLIFVYFLHNPTTPILPV